MLLRRSRHPHTEQDYRLPSFCRVCHRRDCSTLHLHPTLQFRHTQPVPHPRRRCKTAAQRNSRSEPVTRSAPSRFLFRQQHQQLAAESSSSASTHASALWPRPSCLFCARSLFCAAHIIPVLRSWRSRRLGRARAAACLWPPSMPLVKLRLPLRRGSCRHPFAVRRATSTSRVHVLKRSCSSAGDTSRCSSLGDTTRASRLTVWSYYL